MHILEKIDINFKVQTEIDKDDICFYSVLQKPFSLHGLIYENGKYRRMPEAIAKTVSEGVHYLHSNTSGGRIRFQTNSLYIAISAKMCNIGKMDHFALSGSAGFDMFVGSQFYGTFRPPFDIVDGFQSILEFPNRQMREITINFPLYSDVCELCIGLQEDSIVESASPYTNTKPFVFYGSSITQGGCASRPGNAYPAILSRRFNIDFINLGFSGNGKGEQSIADYIASLDMDLFVLDYDHNAPDVAHLQATHYNMYQTVRAAHPNIPIIMMTATTMPRYTDYFRSERRDIIYNSYLQAKSIGDDNVYFWDGSKEFAPYEDYGTVEGCHPNDCGFYGIANSLSKLITGILPQYASATA